MLDEESNAGQLSVGRQSDNDRRSGIDSQKEKRLQSERRSSTSDRRSGKDRRSEFRYQFEVD